MSVEGETSHLVIITSPNDRQKYRHIILDNGLRALLISDEQSCLIDANEEEDNDEIEGDNVEDDEELGDSGDECSNGSHDKPVSPLKNKEHSEKLAAAALCVESGSFDNPLEVEGLAHFLEHCITMGSRDYPKENGLDEFLTLHGGESNATTFYERTLYELGIVKTHFKEALAILASYFVSPLLDKNSIMKEIEPVDTEFLESIAEDDCRVEQFMTTLAKDGHPFRKFSWGNRQSLLTMPAQKGIDVHKYLVEFYQKNYVAENITLAIQSEESLDTLEEWVREIFSLIPSGLYEVTKSQSVESDLLMPFDRAEFTKLYYVESIEKTDYICISWSLPPIIEHYKTKPLRYLENLIGHESEGSLTSYLKDEGYILELTAGTDYDNFDSNKYCSHFGIDMRLTAKGMSNKDEIVNIIFAFLNRLRQEGVQQRIYQEEKLIRELKFQWLDNIDSLQYVKSLAVNMQLYPVEHIIVGEQLLFDYDPVLIAHYLNLMTPERANVIVLSPNFIIDDNVILKESWMKVPYKVYDMPPNWLATPSVPDDFYRRVFLPRPNEFIATDFSLKLSECASSSYPLRLYKDEKTTVWFKKDEVFKTPKACYNFMLISPVKGVNVENSVAINFFLDILEQMLLKEAYGATLAGLSYSLSCTEVSMNICVDGFSQKLENLLLLIIEKIMGFNFDNQTFEDTKRKLNEEYYNRIVSGPDFSKCVRLSILEQNGWTPLEKRLALPAMTEDKVKLVVQQYLSNLYIESLIQGNVLPGEALNLTNLVKNKIQFGMLNTFPKRITAILPNGNNFCRLDTLHEENKSSVVANYYQLGPFNIESFCLLELLSLVMYEPCFDILRTQEGLGYYVSVDYTNTNGVGGLKITVMSPADKFSCTVVDERIEQFIVTFLKKLESLSESEFQSIVESLVKNKETPFNNLQEEVRFNWLEITQSYCCFDRIQRQIGFLNKFTLKQFTDWSLKQLASTSTRRKLSVQIVGNGSIAMADCVCFNECRNHMGGDRSTTSQDTCGFRYLLPVDEKLRANFITNIREFKSKLQFHPHIIVNV